MRGASVLASGRAHRTRRERLGAEGRRLAEQAARVPDGREAFRIRGLLLLGRVAGDQGQRTPPKDSRRRERDSRAGADEPEEHLARAEQGRLVLRLQLRRERNRPVERAGGRDHPRPPARSDGPALGLRHVGSRVPLHRVGQRIGQAPARQLREWRRPSGGYRGRGLDRPEAGGRAGSGDAACLPP